MSIAVMTVTGSFKTVGCGLTARDLAARPVCEALSPPAVRLPYPADESPILIDHEARTLDGPFTALQGKPLRVRCLHLNANVGICAEPCLLRGCLLCGSADWTTR